MKNNLGLFRIGTLVSEHPDEDNVSRWHGRVVGFSEIKTAGMDTSQSLIVVELSNGGYLQNGVYISLMLVHPSNADIL